MGRSKVTVIVDLKALCHYLAVGAMQDELQDSDEYPTDEEFVTNKGNPKKKYKDVYKRWYAYFESVVKEHQL